MKTGDKVDIACVSPLHKKYKKYEHHRSLTAIYTGTTGVIVSECSKGYFSVKLHDGNIHDFPEIALVEASEVNYTEYEEE